MLTAESIQSRLRERPFRPLRIVVSEGQQFNVYQPDLVLVGHRDLMIGLPRDVNSSIYDRVTRVALVHVVALKDLPLATLKMGSNKPPSSQSRLPNGRAI